MRKYFFVLFVLLGILFRFYYQFFLPAFNVDEIDLGNNIKSFDFLRLLKPLKYGQSSPPLYLWLQKIIITFLPFKFWINIKILSFIGSSLTVWFFYKFAKKNLFKIELLLCIAILSFNPYIIYNSLTVKQYSFDLLGIVVFIYYYDIKWFKKYNFIFFIVWSFISNIALFACVGFLISKFFYENKRIDSIVIKKFFLANYKTILAPLPYISYFVWFMYQDGAIELKNYMIAYWHGAFIPLNSYIFKYTIVLFHGIWVEFFSINEILGILFFIASVSIIPIMFFKKKNIEFKKEIILLFTIFLVHIILNICHFYPITSRLIMYISILFLILLASTLNFILNQDKVKKYQYYIIIVSVFVLFFSYKDYIFFKENDVVQLYKTINRLNEKTVVYATNKSTKTINDFHRFTDCAFKLNKKVYSYKKTNRKILNYYLITRVHNKLKPNTTSLEEEIIKLLQVDNHVLLYEKIQGYNIYKIN